MIDTLKQILKKNYNPSIAHKQSQYMKNKFSFYGIPKPKLRQITKPFLQTSLSLFTSEIIEILYQLFYENKREFHYIAIDLLTIHIHKFSYLDFQQLYLLIDLYPWWDSIDALQKPFSLWIIQHPEYLREVSLTWNNTNSIWQKRSAIILQLKHKQNLDTSLLTEIIIFNKNSSEFFIQKAIGWILREYSKTNPLWIKEFIDQHKDLSNLSKKEGLKYIK
ncbi:MAG: DNA alkylation repair protein [Spirochaetota bacterium]|nr:DNA alkylation repair protein [Spirochaetota bacterium]